MARRSKRSRRNRARREAQVAPEESTTASSTVRSGSSSKRRSKKNKNKRTTSHWEPRPERTRQNLIGLAPAAIDSVHLAIDQIDLDSLEGASEALKEMRNLQDLSPA